MGVPTNSPSWMLRGSRPSSIRAASTWRKPADKNTSNRRSWTKQDTNSVQGLPLTQEEIYIAEVYGRRQKATLLRDASSRLVSTCVAL
jgi:hypothetical protein